MPTTQHQIQKQLLALLSDEEKLDYSKILRLSRDLSKHDEHFQRFFVDAKTLIHLGRDSIKDHTTALLELVKNSYDADATIVQIEVWCKDGKDLIRIADNGFGMSRDQLLASWLQIGYSEKRKSKLSKIGRRKTGEKGIGRISTDRLGAKLELRTRSYSGQTIGLRLDWDEFDTEGKDISDINIELFTPSVISLPHSEDSKRQTGTEILITGLRQNWTPSNIENLYLELSALTPPFSEIKDFDIELKNDVAPQYSKHVDSNFLKASEIELTAQYDGKGSDILYTIKHRDDKKGKTELISWQNILTKVVSTEDIEAAGDLKIGPVELKLLFFLREAASVSGTNFKLSELREFLDNNAGIKIYRDNIAVKPYGFGSSQFGFDWLSLAERKSRDPAGIGRGADSYKVTPNQLVGAVFIGRDTNQHLTDSAAREGLVESESFLDLKRFVLGSITILESYRATRNAESQKQRDKTSASSSEEALRIRSQLTSVQTELELLVARMEKRPAEQDKTSYSRPIEKSIEQVRDISDQVDKTIEELLNWNRVLSGLATLGISSAVFGHETENSIALFQTAAENARKLIARVPGVSKVAISELDKSIKHSKRVAAWGAFALSRVQREKRSKKTIQVKNTIDTIANDLRPAFEASSIKLTVTGNPVATKTYQMDIESVLINLLTNAYTASNQKITDRIVNIHIDKDTLDGNEGYFFSVSDTGPGIAKEFHSRIYEPLFSTKTDPNKSGKSAGTGLGLTIAKSIVTELKGQITFDRDPKLKGARFRVWLPLER